MKKVLGIDIGGMSMKFAVVNENGEVIYDSSVRNTYTFIHEFAHILGADDYYDTSYSDNSLLLDGANDVIGSPLGHLVLCRLND